MKCVPILIKLRKHRGDNMNTLKSSIYSIHYTYSMQNTLKSSILGYKQH